MHRLPIVHHLPNFLVGLVKGCRELRRYQDRSVHLNLRTKYRISNWKAVLGGDVDVGLIPVELLIDFSPLDGPFDATNFHMSYLFNDDAAIGVLIFGGFVGSGCDFIIIAGVTIG